MSQALSLIESLHVKAIELSTNYRKAEADLIDVIQQVDIHRVFIQKGYSSLFHYVVQALNLSESVAFNLIAVARKSKEIPELKAEIKAGTITLSNARKIAPVLNATKHTQQIRAIKSELYRYRFKESGLLTSEEKPFPKPSFTRSILETKDNVLIGIQMENVVRNYDG